VSKKIIRSSQEFHKTFASISKAQKVHEKFVTRSKEVTSKEVKLKFGSSLK
jgi:hypothetical protein